MENVNGPGKPTAGTAAALAGFECQIEVSVFAALRILLFTKSAGQVELEPDDEEDSDADIVPSSTREVT